MKVFNRKYFSILLAILWMITLYTMIQNYIQYPPLEESDILYDRRNNMEGSVYKYGILSFIELLLGVVWLFYFFSLPVFIRAVTLVLSLGLVAWGYVDAIHSGGVPSAHALWLSLEMMIIYSYLLLTFFNRPKPLK